ncbi:hypothetical protein SAMN04489712_104125 [Thermomonospora echinospora]|uniref:Uncharacterized protein n=1 Tax=Thermomonospora echinospora TaxID=1992 RepID=A0A1H5YQ33_9ACTN|nr:hypothetical protein [Thermomonospora echinospora]SEG26223.1 hypothetical protein SAMN04489712_104125 [Thermomonospora echinospora]
MRRLRMLPYAAAAVVSSFWADRVARTRRDLREDSARGSNVVETIIIVAGFAGLAFTIYLAVSGKVQNWINKIPG